MAFFASTPQPLTSPYYDWADKKFRFVNWDNIDPLPVECLTADEQAADSWEQGQQQARLRVEAVNSAYVSALAATTHTDPDAIRAQGFCAAPSEALCSLPKNLWTVRPEFFSQECVRDLDGFLRREHDGRHARIDVIPRNSLFPCAVGNPEAESWTCQTFFFPKRCLTINDPSHLRPIGRRRTQYPRTIFWNPNSYPLGMNWYGFGNVQEECFFNMMISGRPAGQGISPIYGHIFVRNAQGHAGPPVSPWISVDQNVQEFGGRGIKGTRIWVVGSAGGPVNAHPFVVRNGVQEPIGN